MVNIQPKNANLSGGSRKAFMTYELNTEGDVVESEKQSQSIELEYDSSIDQVVLRKPAVVMTSEWVIAFEY